MRVGEVDEVPGRGCWLILCELITFSLSQKRNTADETSRDRSLALDQRSDLTGRLVRLMSSVYYGNTKIGASELLFVLCDQDRMSFPLPSFLLKC